MTTPAETLSHMTSVRRAADDGTARKVRLAAGASLAEVGRASGVSKGTISKWERGLTTPRCAAALRWGQVLELLAESHPS